MQNELFSLENSKQIFKDLMIGLASFTIPWTFFAPVHTYLHCTQIESFSFNNKNERISQWISRTYKEKGFSIFWKGNYNNITKNGSIIACQFSLYDAFQRQFVDCISYEEHPNKLFFVNLLSGGLSALIIHAISNSIRISLFKINKNFAQRVLNVNMPPIQFNRQFHALIDFINTAVYLGGYDTAKRVSWIKQNEYNKSILIKLIFARLIVSISSKITHPIWYLYSILPQLEQEKQKGIINFLRRKINDRGGYFKLFRGNSYFHLEKTLVLVFYDQFKENSANGINH